MQPSPSNEKTHEGGVCYTSSQGVVNKTSFYIPGVAPISSRTSRSRKFWNFQHGTREARSSGSDADPHHRLARRVCSVTRQQLMQKLQSLLENAFKVVVQRRTRDGGILALRQATTVRVNAWSNSDSGHRTCAAADGRRVLDDGRPKLTAWRRVPGPSASP